MSRTKNPLRKTAHVPGLTYIDANKGRITIRDDVLGVKHRIEQTWPNLKVYFDEWNETWVITEKLKDGTEQLVFETAGLGEHTFQRIERANTHKAGQDDPLKLLDKENDAVQRDLDRRFEDQMGDVGERLRLALHQDGVIHRPKVFMSNARKRG